jgi:hypothetical protein
MKIRNRNGRTQAAFNALVTMPLALASATRLSPGFSFLRYGCAINPLDKYLSNPAALPQIQGPMLRCRID